MRTVVLALVVALLSACASTQTPTVVTEIPKTVREACDFYKKVKPLVVRYVQYAAAHWESIPADEQKLLLELKVHLATLDSLGVDVCAIADALTAIQEGRDVVKAVRNGGSVDWDAVLSTVLKVASTAAQLKAQGVF